MERIDLILGLECNQNCRFCFNQDLKFRGYRIRDPHETISEGKALGLRKVSISGGEPTISKHFWEVLESCRGLDEVRLITNGLMLSYPAFTQRLKRYPVRNICLSLPSTDPETLSRMTGVRKALPLVKRAIANIRKDLSGTQLTAHVVMSKDNISSLKRHAKELVRLGFNGVNFLHLMPNSSFNCDQIPALEEVRSVLKDIIEEHKESIYIHIGYLEPCQLPGYETYFDTNDFDMEFFSNCNELFNDWIQTLKKNKEQREECRRCRYLQTCLGFWKR
jgi:radical SAM protein with 4Fe4S-binding SPASM domain